MPADSPSVPSGSATTHPADWLVAAVDRAAAPVCVGLDPVFERLPDSRGGGRGAGGPSDKVDAMTGFCRRVVDAVADVVPCIKIQSACFERYGAAGVDGLARTLTHARSAGLVVIDDAKRGDIGISAEHYAAGILGPESSGGLAADWITASAYLGVDGLEPFLKHGGAFALVRTSNPGGDAVQGCRLEDGRTVADMVAGLIAETGRDYRGQSGYSALGAVVGATKPDDAARLRQRMPEQIFLIPGYGAQGGGIDDVMPCFHDNGRGAIVTASRSVIYAFEPGDANWPVAVRDAARKMADEVGQAVAGQS